MRCDVNAKDLHGMTPLDYAVEVPSPEIVRVLLINGANPFLESLKSLTKMEIINKDPRVFNMIKEAKIVGLFFNFSRFG